MLDYINLENFKTIQNQRINLSKINLFIGPNRSGKSTISQAIALIKQSDNKIQWNGTILNLQSFENVLCKKPYRKKIIIQFGGTFLLDQSFHLIYPRVNYGIHLGIDSEGISEIGFDIESGTLKLSQTINRNKPLSQFQLQLEGVKFNLEYYLQLRDFLQIRGYGLVDSNSKLDDREAARQLQALLNVISKQLDFCRFIPTGRGFDKSVYPLLKEKSEIPSAEGVTKQAEVAVSNMAYDHQIKDKINQLMKRVIPDCNIDVRNIPAHNVQVINKDKFGEYPITDEGFGLNQLVFLFQQLVMSENGSTLFIDEPEIALHPASQFDLCSTILDVSKTENKQLVITTHSEHILLGFLDLIMQKKLSSRDFKVYSFEKQDGITQISELKVNEDGELEGSPKGFFAVDMAYIDRFIKNLKAKK